MTPFFGLNQNQVVLNISTNPPRASSDSQGGTAVKGEPRQMWEHLCSLLASLEGSAGERGSPAPHHLGPLTPNSENQMFQGSWDHVKWSAGASRLN